MEAPNCEADSSNFILAFAKKLLKRGFSEDIELRITKGQVKIVKHATKETPGKILNLPLGLSVRHMDVIENSLCCLYFKDGGSTKDTEDGIMRDHDLTKWGIKYFDAAASWLEGGGIYGGTIVFPDRPHHRHLDKVAKRFRYLEFADGTGLDSSP